MQGFYSTSVFLDSTTCFSPPPFPSPLYHDPRIMSVHLPGHRPLHPSSPNQHVEPPLTRPSHQERLLQASAAPNYIHNLFIPTHPSAFNPTQMLPRETTELKSAGIVSRMYSSHFPGYWQCSPSNSSNLRVMSGQFFGRLRSLVFTYLTSLISHLLSVFVVAVFFFFL